MTGPTGPAGPTADEPAGHTVIRIGDAVWLDLWRIGRLSGVVVGVEEHTPTGDPADLRLTPLVELTESCGSHKAGDVLRRGSTIVLPPNGWRGKYPEHMVHRFGYCHEWDPCQQCGRVTAWDEDQVEAFVAAHRAAALDVASSNDAYNRDENRRPARDGALTWDPDSVTAMDRTARLFYQQNRADLAAWLAPDHAGHDLWMTRTHEGVGYWARYLPNDRDDMFSAYALAHRRARQAHVRAFNAAMVRLTTAAHAKPFDSPDLVVGDDGTAYLT